MLFILRFFNAEDKKIHLRFIDFVLSVTVKAEWQRGLRRQLLPETRPGKPCLAQSAAFFVGDFVLLYGAARRKQPHWGNQTNIKLSKRLSHHTCYYYCWYSDSLVRSIFSRREMPHNKIHNRVKIKFWKKSQSKHYLFQLRFITVDSVNLRPQSVPLHIIVCVYTVYIYIHNFHCSLHDSESYICFSIFATYSCLFLQPN